MILAKFESLIFLNQILNLNYMRNGLIMLFFFLSFGMFAQEQVSLENLDDFKDQAGNWQIVGSVTMNRNIDVHEKANEEPVSKKKRKRKKKKEIEPKKPKAVTFTAGTGILLNLNNEQEKDALITNWEHGDIKLELEVMLPKGSNSGIYLQGRYELQLLDSWGVKNPKYSDIGGIYRNWETDPKLMLKGVPPSSNSAKAPGLWQKLSIHFQAPRFDESGQKIAHAKFVSVRLNGVQIHNNVEVPLYTGGQISKIEVPKGPIMIQGDHGPVAIRNMRYQLLSESDVELSSLSFQAFKGEFKGLEELENQEAIIHGKIKKLDVGVAGEEDNYGLIYKGVLHIPEEDKYSFDFGYTGGLKVIVDGEILIENNSADAQGSLKKSINLSIGEHTFQLINIKSAGWRAPKLGMTIKTSSTNPKSFHTYDSYPPITGSVSPIFVDAASEPRMLRAFVAFNGNGKRLSHTIGIGTPEGVNFVYDLSSANLVGMWRGDFVDATPMWHNRGDGSFKPRGAVQWTFLNQAVAALENENSPFPETGAAPDFITKGYSMDKKTNLPVFKHVYKGVEIENKIIADQNNTYLIHQVNFSKTGLTNWYFKVAEGRVQKMPDGSYTIGDQEYYVKILSGHTPRIRVVDGKTELVLPVDSSNIKYEIIW